MVAVRTLTITFAIFAQLLIGCHANCPRSGLSTRSRSSCDTCTAEEGPRPNYYSCRYCASSGSCSASLSAPSCSGGWYSNLRSDTTCTALGGGSGSSHSNSCRYHDDGGIQHSSAQNDNPSKMCALTLPQPALAYVSTISGGAQNVTSRRIVAMEPIARIATTVAGTVAWTLSRT
jgi:hypothetical protein